MTYPETIDWLYSRLPMFTRIGAAAIKKDLTNTLALCAVLNHPQDTFRSIHIAGTNGKGSTSHMLCAILQKAGYKTGLYTSPHIYDFRERIRINGQMIPEEKVVSFVAKMKKSVEKIEPSFFELTVAMAFDYFAEEKVDIAVIETGLGGRLDSTNVITPILSVITNIGYDHMDILGNTLAQIASEKAGIIKETVPVVIGQRHPETEPVFIQKATSAASPVIFAEDQYKPVDRQTEKNKRLIRITGPGTMIQDFTLDLRGIYQQENLCTVLACLPLLEDAGFRLSDTVIHDALASVISSTGLRGRWELLAQNPDIILDVAHNEAGLIPLMHQLREDYPDAVYHFILGFVKDKDLSRAFSVLDPSHKYYFTQAHIPRALPAQALQQTAYAFGFKGDFFEQPDDAMKAAIKNAGRQDVIIACGSFFMIAEINRDYFAC